MPSLNVRHVLPNPDGGWDVLAPETLRASDHFDTQAEAIARAEEIVGNAGGGEVIIHRPEAAIHDTLAERPSRQLLPA